jgi:phosphatidylserine decarboxylase
MFVEKGAPKSIYHPGSSVDILLFEKDRMNFSEDINFNLKRKDANSRYSEGFGESLVETEVELRSEIGRSL